MLTNQSLAPSLKYGQFTELSLRRTLANSPFKSLPLQLIREIFSHLEKLKDVKSVKLVARVFYKESETHLVNVLARMWKVPIKLNTMFDEFKSVARLCVMLGRFMDNYVEFLCYSFDPDVPHIHIHYNNKFVCARDFDKIAWHLQVHKNTDQPYIKKKLAVLDHQSDMPTQKIAVIAMLDIPNDTWVQGIRNDSNDDDWMDAWKTNDGQILFGKEVPAHIKREDNRWRASYSLDLTTEQKENILAILKAHDKIS